MDWEIGARENLWIPGKPCNIQLYLIGLEPRLISN